MAMWRDDALMGCHGDLDLDTSVVKRKQMRNQLCLCEYDRKRSIHGLSLRHCRYVLVLLWKTEVEAWSDAKLAAKIEGRSRVMMLEEGVRRSDVRSTHLAGKRMRLPKIGLLVGIRTGDAVVGDSVGANLQERVAKHGPRIGADDHLSQYYCLRHCSVDSLIF